jgi:DNA-binding TFAR19-related protein (PDSD5 family)
METEVIEKQKRTRTTRVRTQDDAEEARPSEYTSKKDRKDAQARRLEILQTTMERERKRHLFDLVMNPKSFTQTVENLFDTSFLVRNGAVEIALDEKGLPYVENHEGRTEETFPQQTQSIISITPDDWQAITKAWNMQENDEPLVGHRA